MFYVQELKPTAGGGYDWEDTELLAPDLVVLLDMILAFVKTRGGTGALRITLMKYCRDYKYVLFDAPTTALSAWLRAEFEQLHEAILRTH